MKRMHESARTLGPRIPSILMAILLAGPPIAKTDAVLDWNEIGVNTAIGQNPLAQARYAAIVQLAVFEAVKCRPWRLATIPWGFPSIFRFNK